VLTLQDLIFLSTPVRGRSARQVVGHRYERWLIERSVPAATVLAVPSETVAREVTDRFGDASTPHVVYVGVAAPIEAHRTESAPPYIVAFAGRDPRKRTAAVVAGWRAVAPMRVRLKLLTSGGLPPELGESLRGELDRGAVTLIEHVPRRELMRVLGGALALAYPTSDEGFGLPVLEAMAAGTPVLSGLATVTREIGGDAIIALDPSDIPGSIAAAVRQLLDDRSYADEIAARGRARAAQFSWRATAEAYLRLYRTAVERGLP
jgi:glycosyltransferase involved in cell wall biosynthesis